MVLSIIFLVMGALFLFGGISIRNRHRFITGAGIKTQALIIEIIQESQPNNNENSINQFTTYYFPIVEFVDENGNEIRQRLNSTVQPNQLDQYISIAYYEHENGDLEIVQDTKFMGKQFPGKFIGLGVFLMIAGFIRLFT